MMTVETLETDLQTDVQDALRELIDMEGRGQVFRADLPDVLQDWAEDSIRTYVAQGGGRRVAGFAVREEGRLVVVDMSGRDRDLGDVADADVDAALEAVGLRRFHEWNADGKVAVTADGPWSA